MGTELIADDNKINCKNHPNKLVSPLKSTGEKLLKSGRRIFAGILWTLDVSHQPVILSD
ncbi:hypothetical protein N824_20955 [Pedobacter sp. V48]|nr:hypothetical protein N824_20955 [Pedobacter sp. V48]